MPKGQSRLDILANKMVKSSSLNKYKNPDGTWGRKKYDTKMDLARAIASDIGRKKYGKRRFQQFRRR